MTTEFTATAHGGIISIPAALSRWQDSTFRIILVQDERKTQARHGRVMGLHRGVAKIGSDFDAPLPETFLLDRMLSTP